MFINETKNNVENNLKASATMLKSLKIIMVIVSLVLIVAGGVWFAFDLVKSTNEELDPTSSLIIILCGVLLLAFFLCLGKFQKSTLEKTMQGRELHVRFAFDDADLEIVSTASDGSFTSTVKGNYYAITECREDSDLWLVYFNKATAFVMLKSGMIEGSAEDFTAFLKERLGSRYKVVYKQKKK